ncbi:MAG: hypothetical protein KBB11_05370 [Bacteroidales bacterium]|nr:hypothetical protein [Bacteroidales bacterium]HOY38533.1 hypothetical protein [Bacteroidales bacterium]HQP03092.1 hypothetical protein [Bacteroidales bacterium]
MRTIAFVFLIVLQLSQAVYAQNKIFLLNGKSITTDTLSYDFPANIIYYNNPDRHKTKMIDGSEVFSFVDAQNRETVVYTQADKESLSIAEMRSVMQGQAVALNEYNPIWPYLAGFGVGCASMCLPVNSMVSITIPIGYNVGAAFMRPSGSHIMKKYPDLYTDDLFVYGYKERGGNKILKRSVIGSVAGIAVGFTGMFLISTLSK